jgi:glycosyl hydrolase family 43
LTVRFPDGGAVDLKIINTGEGPRPQVGDDDSFHHKDSPKEFTMRFTIPVSIATVLVVSYLLSGSPRPSFGQEEKASSVKKTQKMPPGKPDTQSKKGIAPPDTQGEFPNPIWEGGKDNSIYDAGVTVSPGDKPKYIAVSGGPDSMDGKQLPIWTSTDRRRWTRESYIVGPIEEQKSKKKPEKRPEWLKEAGSPQMYVFPNWGGGKWHAYFSGTGEPGKTLPGWPKREGQRCIIHAESKSSKLDDLDDFKVSDVFLCHAAVSLIDVSLFIDQKNNQGYLLYKEDWHARGSDFPSRIVMRTIGPSGSLDDNLGTETTVIIPDKFDIWEGQSVEAPTLIYNNKANAKEPYFLFYSGNRFDSVNYAVGVARSSRPMGPYTKCPDNPILSSRSRETRFWGTGHQDITWTPTDGWLIFYHAFDRKKNDNLRYLMMDQLHWDRPDGWPRVHDGTPSE